MKRTYIKKPLFACTLLSLGIICYFLLYIRSRGNNENGQSYIQFGIPQQNMYSNNASCQSPATNIVYLKTSKTGSSTLLNIFLRYGDKHNLTFVFTRAGSNPYVRFALDIIPKLVEGQTYNILARHFKYNKTALRKLMPPDTKYVTIVREPAERLRSLFWYMNWDRGLHLHGNKTDPFTYYVDNLKTPEIDSKLKGKSSYIKSAFMEKFAFSHSHFNNETLFNLTLLDRAREFDLVMLTEYFDESVILLRRLMCWDLEGMVYLKKHVNTKPGSGAPFTEEQKQKVRKRMHWEVIAYDFFKKIFMEKISQQDESFWEEVSQLRQLTKETIENCYEGESDGVYIIREDATDKHLCKYLMINELVYASELKKKQRNVYHWSKPQFLE